MVGVYKTQIQSLNVHSCNIGRYDEAVDQVVLECLIIWIIRPVQRSAAGNRVVHQELPAFRELAFVQQAAFPETITLQRIHGCVSAGEGLIEIAAGDDIISFVVFLLKEAFQDFCLLNFALAAVVCLQMQVYKDELPVAALNRDIFRKKTTLQVRQTHRPGEGAGKLDAAGFLRIIPAERQDAGINCPDGRNRVRNKQNLEIVGKCILVI